MSSQHNRERERLQRLQAAQLRARAPASRVKSGRKIVSSRSQEAPLRSIWRSIPGRGKGLLYGLAFGIVFSIVITGAIGGIAPAPFGAICGGVFFLVALAVGTFLGKFIEDKDTGI
jgi:hypothetical protein